VDWRKSVDAVKQLAERQGSRVVSWRYDPIMFTSATPSQFHIDTFTRIADALYGFVDEVVISFMQLYRKTDFNLRKMSRELGNPWWDPNLEVKRLLAAELADLAKERGMMLRICSQPELITTQSPARCIDSQRLADLAGRPLRVKTQGNRPGCECAASRDIGEYDTCPHGCVYCYAVRSFDRAVGRFKAHDPSSPYLFVDPTDPEEQTLQASLDL
jgi:hypothetical protein